MSDAGLEGAEPAWTAAEQVRYDGGIAIGPPAAMNRARRCIISCVSLDRRPTRFALVIRHGTARKLRRTRCPVCGKRAQVVFQLVEAG